MLSKKDPRSTAAWKALENLAVQLQLTTISKLFDSDPTRADKYAIQLGDICFDYAINLVNEEVLSSLFRLAQECHVKESISALFSGDPINETEKRSVLHTALRDFSGSPVLCGGEDVMPGVRGSLNKIKKFCKAVHKGQHTGYTGKSIRYIVNIGIGGSDLGPRMVVDALSPYQLGDMETYFVSNVDAHEIDEVLKKIRPDRTLFLVASKTFTTTETMANANTARSWFLQKAKNNKHIARHFVAISTNEKAALAFGIDRENIFGFRDWVGGRFSLWGPVGLSIALSIGYKRFEELLRGAYSADKHFRESIPEQNIPMIMALLGIWYTNFLGTSTEAILPYDQRLQRFPAYLQQASMESNGKSTDRGGHAVEYDTAPVTWGEPGTNGQHAFFQLLHQGTQLVPCDFIAFAKPHHDHPEHHQLLISNFLAQTEALMKGKTETEVQAEMEKSELTTPGIASILPFRVFRGNRPSNSFLIRELSPFNLGALIALYEHKIFVQGVIWNIYSFDQWGVELGKQLADNILPHLSKDDKQIPGDPVTARLLTLFKRWQG
jgi:glucose-6-phosphate isomerase